MGRGCLFWIVLSILLSETLRVIGETPCPEEDPHKFLQGLN